MTTTLSRRAFIAGTGALGLMVLAGCGNSGGSSSGALDVATSSGGTTTDSGGVPSSDSILVGTLETEDLLPYRVAVGNGVEIGGIGLEIVPFQSATELIAAFSAGEVDLAMTDIMVAASMFAGGVDLQVEWVTLGAEAGQGRFGIMVGPDSDVKSLGDLANQPIGVGSNTILEYVMDRLMSEAGVPEDEIVVEELQKLPVRYQSMLTGSVPAAALPGSLLALGEVNGCRTIADDTKGENISQSIMIAGDRFFNRSDNAALLAELKSAWDEAAKSVNDDPEAYRGLLVSSANLSNEVADTYPISTYPTCELPTNAMVDPVLDWMEGKGYLVQPLTYDEATGRFSMASQG